MPQPNNTSAEVFKVLLDWNLYKNKPVGAILEATEDHQRIITPAAFSSFDLSSFDHDGKYSFAGFSDDILSYIRRPLGRALIRLVEPRHINLHVCSFHFADDLPSEFSPHTECAKRMEMLEDLFPDHDYWYGEFWTDLNEVFKPYHRADKNKLKTLEQHFDAGLQRQGHNLVYYEFINSILTSGGITISSRRRAKRCKKLRVNGLNTLAMLILDKDSFMKAVKRPDSEPSTIEIGSNHKDGEIYPIFLFEHIQQLGIVYVNSPTQVFNNLGNDAGGVRRNFVTQCIDFVFNGPGSDIKQTELQMRGDLMSEAERAAFISKHRWSRPLLREAFPDAQFTFFPFRAHRKSGTFVAFTIAKALNSDILPTIDFPIEFYRAVALAKPEDQLSDQEKEYLNNYHDAVYAARGVSLLDFIISQIHEYWGGDYVEGTKVRDILFPHLEVFDTPFGPPVETDPLTLEDIDNPKYASMGKNGPAVIESFDAGIITRADYDRYIEDYRRSTYLEFRALLWEFRQVFDKAFDVELFSRLWNPLWLPEFTGKMNNAAYKVKDILTAFTKIDHQIDSLVRNKKTGEVYKIQILKAIEMFLDQVPNSALSAFVALFTGSRHSKLVPSSLSLAINQSEDIFECKVTENPSYSVIDSEQRSQIIRSIYLKELELFGVDQDEAELVSNETFYTVAGHTCFSNVDIHSHANQFQLIYALVQQLNEPSHRIEN